MSKKGNFKLSGNGFEYNKHMETKHGITLWRCDKYKQGCKGKAQSCRIGSKYMMKVYHKHNDNCNLFNMLMKQTTAPNSAEQF